MFTQSQTTRVAIIAASYPPAFLGGGPARTLSALVRDAPRFAHISVITPNRDSDGSNLAVKSDTWTTDGSAEVFYVSAHVPLGLMRGYKILRDRKPDILYINSFFSWQFSIVPQILTRFRFWGSAQTLLAPRGEFDEGAIAIRSKKKKLYLFFYKLLRLHASVTWHASAEMEAVAIRRLWGNRARILVREDETSLPPEASKPVSSTDRLNAAFLGRIAPKKGLLVALRALEDTKAAITLNIYGPEEDAEYARECHEAARLLPANAAVNFRGPILPESVRETLRGHDVMLMPTAGENFGHVIAESLSVSCPVMCTSATPWTEFLTAGGGLVVDSLEPHDWTVAIERLATASPADRLALRLRAGEAFEAWQASSKGPHIFELLRQLN